MEFKLKVTVFGNSIYDVEAKDETEAKLKVRSLAEKDYHFHGDKLYFGICSLVCPDCKTELSSYFDFCFRCGKKIERKDKI